MKRKEKVSKAQSPAIEDHLQQREDPALQEYNFHRSVLDSLTVPFFIYDYINRSFFRWNKTFSDVSGYSDEEISCMRLLDFAPESEHDLLFNMFEEFINRGQISFEMPILSKDGTSAPYLLSGNLLNYDGKTYAVGIGIDVTKRKQAESFLKQSEEKYRLLASHVKDQVWIMDMDLKWTYINPSVERLWGYTLEELQQLPLNKFLSEKSYQKGMNYYSIEMPKALKADSNYYLDQLLELESYCKDGRTIWTENTFTLVHDENGQPSFILGQGRNITDRKKIEAALQASERNFHRSLDESPLGVRISSAEGETIYANKAILDIYGYESVEELQKTPVTKRYTPESHAEFLMRKEKRLRGEVCPSEYDISIVRKDGAIRHLQVFRKEIIWNGEQQSQVIYNDITERKKIEKKLRDEEQRFRALAEQSSDIIVLVNPKGVITYENPAIERVLGFNAKDRIGSSLFNLVHPDDLKYFNDTASTALGDINAAVLKSEVRLRHRDGSWHTFEVTGSTLVHDKVIEGGIINLRDITERKLAEEVLRKNEQKYLELSRIDDLTKLYNARHFYAELKKDIDRSNRYEHPLTLLMLDLDKFKVFNDTYGHLEGDYVLARLGQVIKRCLRETDSAYRYGGEEFMIILPMTTNEEGVVTAKRIQEEFRKEAFSPVAGQELYVTMSIGLAQYELKEEMRSFVRRVDQLMYQAKHQGRDRICAESEKQQQFEW